MAAKATRACKRRTKKCMILSRFKSGLDFGMTKHTHTNNLTRELIYALKQNMYM